MQMPDIVQAISHYISQIPFGIRFIGLLMLGTSIHDALFSPSYIDTLGEISYKVAQGEFWRLFTATLVSNGFLRFFITFGIFTYVGHSIEVTIGTLIFVLDFFLKGFLINFLTFLFNMALWYVQPTFMSTMSYGLQSMLVYYQASKCIASPYKKVTIIREFPNYIIGAVFIGLIILISTSLSIIVAMQIAFIEQLLFNGMIIRLSPNTIQKIEHCRLYQQFTTFISYKLPSQNLQEPKPNKPVQIGTDELPQTESYASY